VADDVVDALSDREMLETTLRLPPEPQPPSTSMHALRSATAMIRQRPTGSRFRAAGVSADSCWLRLSAATL
jgi:hypothetical protein